MLRSVKTSVLCWFNLVLFEFQKYYSMPRMKMYLSKRDGSSQLKVVFLPISLRIMLENDYRVFNIVIVFPFIFSNSENGWSFRRTIIWAIYTSSRVLSSTNYFSTATTQVGTVKMWITWCHTLRSSRFRFGACLRQIDNQPSTHWILIFSTIWLMIWIASALLLYLLITCTSI